MTENEMDAEFGRLVRERAEVKQALACLESKLSRAAQSFRTAAVAIETGAEWAIPDGTENGLAVPSLVQSWPSQEYTLPPLDELARWLMEKKEAEERLEKINELLPD